MKPEHISQQTIPRQLQKQIYEQYLQAVNLNEMLFSSLPHPAMLIRGRDKVIVAANKIALEMGAKVGGHCWREFRKTQFISLKDKDVIAKYRDIVPAELGIRCTFCLGDECLSESPKQKTTVDAFGKTWDIFWIRVSDDIYLHHCIDITEHKQMENALSKSKSNECLATVLDSLDSAVYVADFKSYEILFVNKYIRDRFGDIEGRTCWQTIQIGQKGPCPFCTNDRLVSDTGVSTGLYQWEFQNTVTGRWYECRDQAIPWTGKALVRMEIATDITERKQIEEALRKSVRKMHAVFDQTFQFIGLMTIDGILIEANKTALEFSGIEASSVLNKPFWQGPWWEHSPELQKKVREAAEKAARGEVVRFEATHIDKDGMSHYVDFSLKPVKDETGKVLFLLPEGRDITDRKRAEEMLRVANEKLHDLSVRDHLTGLLNRRYMYDTLELEIARSRRVEYPVCLIMMDIDHFKMINDTYGHEAGDQVLKAFSGHLKDSARSGDFLFRYGGDEFLWIFPNTSAHTVQRRAEQLQQEIEKMQVVYDNRIVHFTISAGIAICANLDTSVDALIRSADQALYRAKAAGRNCVML